MPSEEQGAAERFFEDLGYECENTEIRTSRKGGSKIYDLLGFVDFMAFRDSLVHSVGQRVDVRHARRPIVHVQATDRGHASDRWNKIRGLYTASLMLRSGGNVALAAVGGGPLVWGDRYPETLPPSRPSVDVRIVTYSDWKNTESWRDLERWPEG